MTVGNTHFDALLSKAQDKRIARARLRPIDNIQWNRSTGRYEGTCMGSVPGVEWHPSITISPTRRAFKCDCPDHIRNAPKFGPCKHVISLAIALKGA